MRLTITFLLAFLALPASAEWRFTADTATWYAERPTAVVEEVRDALLWHRATEPLFGALFTAALPNLRITATTEGRSELRIDMPRAQAEAWLTSYAGCPADATTAERLACVDADLVREFKRIHAAYLKHLRDAEHPVRDSEL